MYARKFGERELTFDFAEGLVKDNLLFADRETNSLWSQLQGKAISGEMRDTPLKLVPSLQTTWKFWRQQHPDTRVMVVAGEKGRPYYYRNWKPGTPRRQRIQAHDPSALGLGLAPGGEAVFFPFTELRKARVPFVYSLGEQQVTIHYDDAALTAWAENAAGELLPAVLVYRHGWLGFYPESKVFVAEKPVR